MLLNNHHKKGKEKFNCVKQSQQWKKINTNKHKKKWWINKNGKHVLTGNGQAGERHQTRKHLTARHKRWVQVRFPARLGWFYVSENYEKKRKSRCYSLLWLRWWLIPWFCSSNRFGVFFSSAVGRLYRTCRFHGL